jgi:hypothetical protein
MAHSNKDYLMPSLDPDVSNAQLAHERRLALEEANLSAVLRSQQDPRMMIGPERPRGVVVSVDVEVELCKTCSEVFQAWLQSNAWQNAKGYLAMQVIKDCPSCREQIIDSARNGGFATVRILIEP